MRVYILFLIAGGLFCVQAVAQDTHPDAVALDVLADKLDADIAARERSTGQQQMSVTLEVSQPDGELLKRLVRYAHEPVPFVYGEDAPLYRVWVDYLDGDSVHYAERYYYEGGDVFMAELHTERNECQGRRFYFRNRRLVQVTEWLGEDCEYADAPDYAYLSAKGLPEAQRREALFRQMQAREYQAAFLAFSRTLQQQGR